MWRTIARSWWQSCNLRKMRLKIEKTWRIWRGRRQRKCVWLMQRWRTRWTNPRTNLWPSWWRPGMSRRSTSATPSPRHVIFFLIFTIGFAQFTVEKIYVSWFLHFSGYHFLLLHSRASKIDQQLGLKIFYSYPAFCKTLVISLRWYASRN